MATMTEEPKMHIDLRNRKHADATRIGASATPTSVEPSSHIDLTKIRRTEEAGQFGGVDPALKPVALGSRRRKNTYMAAWKGCFRLVGINADIQDQTLERFHSERPKFLQSISVDKDGGLDEVPELWHALRLVNAAILAIILVVNACALWTTGVQQLLSAEVVINSPIENYMLTTRAAKLLLPDMYKEHLVALSPANIAAALEVAVLIAAVIWASLMLSVAFFGGSFAWWRSLSYLFWEMVPFLSRFSSMKLLYQVHPVVLSPRLHKIVKAHRPAEKGGRGENIVVVCLKVLVTIAVHVVIAAFGFDFFMVKFAAAAPIGAFAIKARPLYSVVLRGVVFLNQMFGVVDVEAYSMSRLFRFVFGGEDASFNSQERQEMDLWKATVAREFWQRKMNFLNFFASMMTFSDNDFQHLMVTEYPSLGAQQKLAKRHSSRGVGDQTPGCAAGCLGQGRRPSARTD
eukprot:TRINITY_DN11914_c0_g1_i2.p1 TRINITY_DN11914_c0_g1~~TRINITY_DN11914_c0_g1_i2.p1  ORF type:complete len:486 (-),score=89.38 TRINITY_DN11914_c0_g1_i2:162-1538(-)